MSATTSKPITDMSSENTLRGAFNDSDQSLTTSTFVTAKVGHKITRTVISAVIDDYSYLDGAVLLYTLRITYSNPAHDDVDSVERTV